MKAEDIQKYDKLFYMSYDVRNTRQKILGIEPAQKKKPDYSSEQNYHGEKVDLFK